MAWTDSSLGYSETRIVLRRSAGSSALSFDPGRVVSSFKDEHGQQSHLPNLRFDDRGVLWLSYSHDNGAAEGFHVTVVDRSCDGGITWSGPVALASPGMPEGAIVAALAVDRPARILVLGDADPQMGERSDVNLFLRPLE